MDDGVRPVSSAATSPGVLEAMRQAIPRADRVLLALDFDGTLAPIVPCPEAAALPVRTAEVLRDLAASGLCQVAIVSGRSLDDLRRKLPPGLTCVGNHGLEIEAPGFSFAHPEALQLREAVDQACWDLEAGLCMIRGVSVERKGLSATVHYRRAREELRQWIKAAVALTTRPYQSRLRVVPALQAWELRPRVDWDKGSAVRLLLKRLGASRPLLICAGDDRTDEDMFRVSPGAISIRVGDDAPTRARYRVSEPAGLVAFLDWIRANVLSSSTCHGAPLLSRS